MGKILFPLILIATFVGAIYYLLLHDKDRDGRLAFQVVVNRVSELSVNLDGFIKKQQSMPTTEKVYTDTFIDSLQQSQSLEYRLKVFDTRVEVTIQRGEDNIKNASIVFEPQLKDGRVLWKCSGGSLLLKYRDRVCSVGKGLHFNL